MNRQTLVKCFQLYYFLLKRDKKNSIYAIFNQFSLHTYIHTIAKKVKLNSERKVQGTDLFLFFFNPKEFIIKNMILPF